MRVARCVECGGKPKNCSCELPKTVTITMSQKELNILRSAVSLAIFDWKGTYYTEEIEAIGDKLAALKETE